MLILVCNVGSTSLKYKLYDMPGKKLLAESKIERVGDSRGSIFSYRNHKNSSRFEKNDAQVPGYSEGINLFLKYLTDKEYGAVGSSEELDAIAFKTVHAKGFNGVHILTDEVIDAMEDYISIAPLHNRFYAEAIRKFKQLLPEKTMVGVFETYFHRTIPSEARMYGIPYEWFEKYKIQKYGFHGSSHQFIAEAVQELAGGKDVKAISCHLGGSSSITAIQNGVSVDNSFGFSTQSGVFHASRIGDIDPFIPVYLTEKEGYSPKEVIDQMVNRSGLYGLSGVGKDLRDIEEEARKGNKRAQLAIDTFCYQVKKFIGSYFAVLGGLDYLVFTGGIGENSSAVRSKICDGLGCLGIVLDEKKNLLGEAQRVISADDAPVKVMVIPTNEEVVISENVYSYLEGNQ